jgi:predicted acyltransferase
VLVRRQARGHGAPAGKPPPPSADLSEGRAAPESLDVFRGATIAAMILRQQPGRLDVRVRAPAARTGSVHVRRSCFRGSSSSWASRCFAFARPSERGDRTSQVFGRIAQRCFFSCLGLALTVVASWPAVSVTLRFPGVLQRIALSYLIAALVIWKFEIRGWMTAIAVLLLGTGRCSRSCRLAAFPAER